MTILVVTAERRGGACVASGLSWFDAATGKCGAVAPTFVRGIVHHRQGHYRHWHFAILIYLLRLSGRVLRHYAVAVLVTSHDSPHSSNCTFHDHSFPLFKRNDGPTQPITLTGGLSRRMRRRSRVSTETVVYCLCWEVSSSKRLAGV